MYMYVNMILDTYFPHKTLQSIALWINHIRTCVGIGCELKKGSTTDKFWQCWPQWFNSLKAAKIILRYCILRINNNFNIIIEPFSLDVSDLFDLYYLTFLAESCKVCNLSDRERIEKFFPKASKGSFSVCSSPPHLSAFILESFNYASMNKFVYFSVLLLPNIIPEFLVYISSSIGH